MTVTAAETRVEYAGNGTTTVFTYPYQFFQNDDLDVWVFDDASGTGLQAVLGVDYTVTGAMNPSGGNVTAVIPPPPGTTVIIINDPDIIQATHYVNADDFPADSHEQALDRLTKICQRLSDRIDRAVRAPDYAPEDSVPDADTLVGLVEQAEEAADNSAASAAEAAASAQDAATSAASMTDSVAQAAQSADAAAQSANSALNYSQSAAASADAAAASAESAQVHEIDWHGPWSASVQYEARDAVFFAGSSWIANQPSLGSQPDTSPAIWELMAEKGDVGPGGPGTGDMLRSQNLGDVLSITQARINLGLGNSAVLNVGTTANTVAAGNDPRLGIGSAYVSANPPVGQADGALWWESETGLLYVNYNDGDTTQWVIACPQPDISLFASKSYVDSAIAAAVAAVPGVPSGTVAFTLTGPIAPAGWLMFDDGNIGDALSGANYANNDSFIVFTLLFNGASDANCPLYLSSGAPTSRAAWGNPNAAFNTGHCRIAMPKMLGRALAAAGFGAGLSGRGTAETAGEEAHIQTLNEMVLHGHSMSNPNPPSSMIGSGSGALGSPGSSYPFRSIDGTLSQGFSFPANVMQPTTFLNAMVKL